MTSAVLWTIAGLLVGVASPPLLRLGMRRGIDAGLLLMSWVVLMSFTVSAVALPVVAYLVHGCWLPLTAGLPGWADPVAGLLSGVAVVIAAMRGAWQLGSTTRRRHRVHARHVELIWLLTEKAPRPGGVLWLPTSEPHAYSLAGDPPLVVLSAGIRERLGQGAVGAVVSHEKAHIRRRHHSFIAVAQALSAGLGWLPLARQSPSLVRTLIELDADTQAARIHGTWPLRQAIQALQHTTVPAVSLGIAAESTQLRLARLATLAPDGPSRRRGPGAWTVMTVSAVLVFVALVLEIALVACGT